VDIAGGEAEAEAMTRLAPLPLEAVTGAPDPEEEREEGTEASLDSTPFREPFLPRPPLVLLVVVADGCVAVVVDLTFLPLATSTVCVSTILSLPLSLSSSLLSSLSLISVSLEEVFLFRLLAQFGGEGGFHAFPDCPSRGSLFRVQVVAKTVETDTDTEEAGLGVGSDDCLEATETAECEGAITADDSRTESDDLDCFPVRAFFTGGFSAAVDCETSLSTVILP
jgi:hypothetical protein